MSHMLEVRGLTVYYGYVNALTDVNIHVDEGEIITLIGSNGAGKTSTLMSISGLAEKTAGQVFFQDKEITKMSPDRIVKLGIAHVPEGRKIFPQLSVRGNLISGTFGKKGITKAEIATLIERNYELFPRLKERIGQTAGTLSGGEQQMLAIGRALMSQPKLLLLDEPSMGLAPNLVLMIFDLIESINKQGTTILLIEQNANMALSIANRAYVLETGNIVIEGKASDLARDERVKNAYLGGKGAAQKAAQ